MRVIDCVATVGAWSWFGTTLLIFDPLLRVAGLLGDKPLQKMTGLMARILSVSIRTGLCRLKIEGLGNIPKGQYPIIVCNHQSLVESFLPFWILEKLKPTYVAKKVMGKWIPSASYVLRRANHCLIDRKDRDQALANIGCLADKVANGQCSAVIFPEGTRSTDGKLNKFKHSGLQLLLEKAPNAPVLPMVIHNGDAVYPKGLPHVKAGSVVSLRFLPVIERKTGDFSADTVEQIHQILSDTFQSIEKEQA